MYMFYNAYDNIKKRSLNIYVKMHLRQRILLIEIEHQELCAEFLGLY